MAKAYHERTDLEKLRSQWKKLTGLHSEEQWSAAIVRAATAAELAANFTIRKEFESETKLPVSFVNDLLRWANGIEGKFNRLLVPLFRGTKKSAAVGEMRALVEKINKERNAIIHSGEFRNEEDATAVIEDAKLLIERLIGLHEPSFTLAPKKRSRS